MIPDAVLPHDGLRKYSAPDFTVPGLVFLLFPREVYLILGVRNNVCPLYWNVARPGKVPPIRGNLVHFPGEKWQNGAEINIFEGKVHQMTGKLVHFPDTDEMILT